MKKIVFTFIFIAGLAQLSAQLKVNTSGDVIASKNIYLGSTYTNFLGTNGNFPIVLKANGILAGFTGINPSDNVSFGYGSLLNSSAGTYNTAIGSSALRSNTTKGTKTGNGNTAIGSSALYSNETGVGNTATGSCALLLNNGDNNVAVGGNALNPNTSGSYNTAVGNTALYGNTEGNYNTAVGYNAGAYNSNSLSNTTCIGYGATATVSNQVVIGNYTVTSVGVPLLGVLFLTGGQRKTSGRMCRGLTLSIFCNRLLTIWIWTRWTICWE